MKKFKPTQNRTALISNEVFEINRYNLKINSQKLLFGLAQNIDHTNSLFPEMEVEISGLWDFLDIADRKDKYEVIRDALFDIVHNPLEIKVSKTKWAAIPWMSVEYNEENSRFVTFCFHEKAKPYLLHLKEYQKIKGIYISKLQSKYATWLYPVFKMVQTKYFGTHEISIERLKEYTFTDKTASYNKSTATAANFFRKVIGIKWNTKTKSVEIIKDSPLWDINEKTDISVTVPKITKNGRKYAGLIFHVQSKTTAKDKGSNISKKEYVSTIEKKNIRSAIRIPMSEVFANANASKISVQEYLKISKYWQKNDGYAYKTMSESEYNEYIKSKEPKEHRGKTRTIFDVLEEQRKK